MADTPSLTDERITAIFRKVFNLIDSRPVGKQLEFVRAIESEVRASVVPQVDAVMEQAQVFASAWSLVGGLFDSGDGLAHAEQMRADLRTMVEALAAAPQCPQPQAEPSPEVEREFVREAMRRFASVKSCALIFAPDGPASISCGLNPSMAFEMSAGDELVKRNDVVRALSAEGSGGAQ